VKNKRGRKKGTKNISLGEPHNLSFWKITLKRPEEVHDFLTRGDSRQKEEIKNILLYLKRAEIDFFDDVNGEEILRKLNER